MKLFLTSGGVSTEMLRHELLELAGKPASELQLAFIPTASNVKSEDKSWLIDELVLFKNLGFAKFDIVDIAALENNAWQARLDEKDILVVGGGDTSYLVDLMRKIGFDKQLFNWLKSKVLVGISAGSVMCCPTINPKGQAGFSWVDFLIVPHKDAPYRNRTSDEIQAYATQMGKKTFWIDDESAIKVDGKSVMVVGSGNHTIFT